MFLAILVTTALTALLAAMLLLPAPGAANETWLIKGINTANEVRLIERIDDLLPQTQCGRCTFAGCKPYATAIARGEADINQCPPGGEATVVALAALMHREARPVDPKFGTVPRIPAVAWIDEPACIGCMKCIQACPVDAIVGAAKFMHTVISAQCTGCELCIPPCPVDCIEMRPLGGYGRQATGDRTEVQSRSPVPRDSLSVRACSP